YAGDRPACGLSAAAESCSLAAAVCRSTGLAGPAHKRPAQPGEQQHGVVLADPLPDTVVLRILFTEDRWLSFLLAPDAHALHRWAWTAGWAYRRERVTASATIRRRRWSSTGLTR